MSVPATMVVLVITPAVLATTMADGVIRLTDPIHPGRLGRMGTTRIHITGTGVIPIHTLGVIPIHTMGVIRTPIRTTSQDMVTTLQLLQRCSAAWVSSATTTA
jgi:hypothetical protein